MQVDTAHTDATPGPTEVSDRTETRWYGVPFVRWELVAMAAVLVAFGLIALDGVLHGAPFGHDEAVYSAKARTFVDGSPDGGFWNDFRAPGLPFMLQVVWGVRATEPYLRMVVVAWGALGLLVTWLLGRFLFERRVGVIAAAGLAVSPIWVSASTHVWPDVPGAVLGVMALAAVIVATQRGRVSWWAVLAVPLTLAATAVRYGAPGPVVVGGAVIVIWRWRAVVRDWPRVVAIGVITAVPLYFMLFTNTVFRTEDPPLASAMELRPNRGGTLADGWVAYWDQLPELLAQPAVMVLFAGIGLALVAKMDDPGRRAARRAVMGICVATFVLLATSLSGELRYLSPLLPWLWIASAVGLSSLVGSLERKPAIVLGVVLALGAGIGVTASTADGADLLADRFQIIRETTRDTEWPDDCRIVTSYAPQVAWYSECATATFGTEEEPVSPGFDATHVLVVLGGKRQPSSLEDWLDANAELQFTHGDPAMGSLDYVEVFVPKG